MKPFRVKNLITNIESKSITYYFKELKNCEPFKDLDEEFDCADRASKGDQKAINRLVLANLRFVVTVAKQYQRKNIKLDDLINQGNIGLIEAAKRFDSTKGTKFITHAVWWIRKEMLEFISNNQKTIRVPNNKLVSHSNLLKAIAQLEQDINTKTNVDLIDSYKKVSDLKFAEDVGFPMLSLDFSISEDDSTIVSDLVEGDQMYDNDLIFDEGEKALHDIINKLNDKESEVIKSYFGIDNHCSKSLGDIAKDLNLSDEGVRQIKNNGLKKLTKMAKEIGIESFNL